MTAILPRAIGTATAATLLAGVVAIAAAPTGAAQPAGLIPATSRVAADVSVAHVHVLLVSDDQQRLGALIAYRGEKGWLAARPAATPVGTQAAWTTTRGGGGVPALSIVFGNATTPTVRVTWSGGAVSVVRVGGDGTWLCARAGQVAPARVELVAANGAVVTVTGP